VIYFSVVKVYEFLIVGAGISGISTAVELSKKAINYIHLEHNSRAGGRIKTLIVDGVPLELGAARFFSYHQRMNSLCAKYSVETEEFKNVDASLFYAGNFYPSYNNYMSNLPGTNPNELLEKLLSENGITNSETFWQKAKRNWDEILLKDWLTEKGVQKENTILHFLGDIDVQLDQTSLLEAAYFSCINFESNKNKTLRLKKGMTGLIEKIIKTNDLKIKFDTTVIEIQKNQNVFIVKTNKENFLCSEIIFTQSLPAIASIRLPEEARTKLHKFLMCGNNGKSVKGFFHTVREPKHKGLQNYVITDEPFRLIRRKLGLWELYLLSLKKTWTESDIKSRLEFYFGKGNIKNLIIYPYTGLPFKGCYWVYNYRSFHHLHDFCKTISLCPGIYSIGEHFSSTPNWIEGSLESAENLISELKVKLKKSVLL
jgi:monoamine oxidase